MSAIAGILWFRGQPAQRPAIEQVANQMVSYGPDGQVCWTSGPVALGHCMLRTTREAVEERAPLFSTDARYCLVWDGRLDNREELRRALLGCGEIMRDDSDAELALKSFVVWGRDCPRKLYGDFAFAVWDAHTGSLFCVRDQVGARPLYWARTSDFFAFASHDEALLNLPGVTGQFYGPGLARLLSPGVSLPADPEDESRTWYENVRFMLAGQSAVISAEDGPHFETYWKPPPGAEATYASDAECQEAFLEVFGAAVRARLRSAGDIGILMSGGLDTAGIVAGARREVGQYKGQVLHAYSAISDRVEECVETQCIQSMSAGMESLFHAVSVPSFTGVANVPDLLKEAWPYSHPEDNDIWLQAVLCRVAARNGHRIVLQGAHGDLTNWSPSRYIAYLMRAGQWRSAWRECLSASRGHNYLRGKAAWRIGLESLWTAQMPARVKSGVAAFRGAAPVMPRLLTLDFLRSLGWSHADASPAETPDRALPTLPAWHAQVLGGLTHSRSAMPRVAGRCGVESRDPWEDRRVIEFFLKLPVQFRVRNGRTKYLVRSAFQNDLADCVRLRQGKEHLGNQFTAAVLRETNECFRDLVNDKSAVFWTYADRSAAQRVYETYISLNTAQSRQDLFALMTASTWLARMKRL